MSRLGQSLHSGPSKGPEPPAKLRAQPGAPAPVCRRGVELVGRLRTRFGLVLALVCMGGCARTTFSSTWMNPAAGAGNLRGKPVAAFVVADDEGRRRAAEDALARELAKRGVRAYPGYQLTGGEPSDFDALRNTLGQQKVENAIVMRIVDRRRERNYLPGYLVGGPGFVSQFSYSEYGGWAAVYNSGYPVTNEIVWVETMVYSVRDGKPLWRSVSRTLDPLRVSTVLKSLADNAANEMKKAGLM
jgi:hypothetical protein